MNQQTKNRIIGGTVLVAVAAIFIPVLFHHSERENVRSVPLSENIPKMPTQPHVSLQLPAHVSVAQEQEETSAKPAVVEQMPASTTIIQSSNTEKPATASPSTPAAVTSAAVASTVSPPVTPTAASPVASAATPAVVSSAPVERRSESSKPVVANATLWSVQLASFTNVDNANRLVKRLQKEGYHAYSRKSEVSAGRMITRVFVGPVDRQAAIQLQQKIQRALHLKGVVSRYSA